MSKRGERKGHFSNPWNSGSGSWGGGGWGGGSHSSHDDDDSDFLGLEWQTTDTSTTPPTTAQVNYNNNTSYSPINFSEYIFPPINIGPIPIFPGVKNPFAAANATLVQFEVREKSFEVASALRLEKADDDLAGDIKDAIEVLLDGGSIADTVADFNSARGDYELVSALDAEGRAKAGATPGYAKNFFLGDEISGYLGLLYDTSPEDHTNDVTVAEIGIEVELTKKGERQMFDLLFNGGTAANADLADVLGFLASLDEAELKKYVEEIEITYNFDFSATNGGSVPFLTQGLQAVIGKFEMLAATTTGIDIEVEQGDVKLTKWAANAIDTMLTELTPTMDS